MDLRTWVTVAFMAIGMVIVLRAVLIVATKSVGRFRGDPFVTLLVGFALISAGHAISR